MRNTSIRNRVDKIQDRYPHMGLATAYRLAQKSAGDVQALAAEIIVMERANQFCPDLSPSASLAVIKNRFPRLWKIANRRSGWESLSDLEPIAHAAYMEAVQLPHGDAAPAWPWTELLNHMRELAVQRPELGYEGRWDAFKQEDPDQFWRFVLACEPDPMYPGKPLVYSRSNPSDAALEWQKQVRTNGPAAPKS